jgi:hypothetical protein
MNRLARTSRDSLRNALAVAAGMRSCRFPPRKVWTGGRGRSAGRSSGARTPPSFPRQ